LRPKEVIDGAAVPGFRPGLIALLRECGML
jgi:hypothetical protein